MNLPAIDALDVAVEITKEQWDERHGVLPPIYCTVDGSPGFAISEPFNHIMIEGTEVPTFGTYFRKDGKYWAGRTTYLRKNGRLLTDSYGEQWSSGWEAV